MIRRHAWKPDRRKVSIAREEPGRLERILEDGRPPRSGESSLGAVAHQPRLRRIAGRPAVQRGMAVLAA